ncbi:hypothetical protein [Pseudovibrio sp. SPO723]|uniref:hypothetical protein n=1 Tax=Nesiotobacter zosterae TaxID=392721 RepID=UPI0029C26F18|nr:hypothetical protein [Pseudovibrio sp. SPO723]MDX5592296.1 hypothetical protein [Pseudovibrio sp. SPO723]
MSRILKLFFITLVCAIGWPAFSNASQLQLSGDERWLVLAAREDRQDAIMEARESSYFLPRTFVVRAKNGWYAILSGPVQAQTMEQIRKADYANAVPEDAYLSKGSNYRELIWSSPEMVRVELDGNARASAQLENLKVEVVRKNAEGNPSDGEDFVETFLDITLHDANGAPLYALKTDTDVYSSFGNSLEMLRILPDTPYPQVIVRRYTGGAHCCIDMSILTTDEENNWVTVRAGTFDAGANYRVFDLDGDGTLELLTVDQSFLYLFAPYAGSLAPLEIQRLEGTRIVNVSADPAYRSEFVSELNSLEEYAAQRADLWNANGFLAAWAAVKTRLGDFIPALARVTESHGPSDGFGVRVCPDGSNIENCSYEQSVVLPFPAGLTVHLVQQGYLASGADENAQ